MCMYYTCMWNVRANLAGMCNEVGGISGGWKRGAVVSGRVGRWEGLSVH